MKFSYSFEDRATDSHRQTNGIDSENIINVLSNSYLSNDVGHAYESWKLGGDEDNKIDSIRYLPRYTRGGKILYIIINK